MKRKDPFGRNIIGFTDIHDRKKFEHYLEDDLWNWAHIWVKIEYKYLRSKVNRQSTAVHMFGVVMSLVMAFLTWVFLFPGADPKELEAFPLATLCNNLFLTLCQTVPGGRTALIIGLISLPFVLCTIFAIIGLIYSNISLESQYKKIREKEQSKDPSEVLNLLKKLEKSYSRYSSEFYALIFYALFAGIFTGGVMVFSSVPHGLNPFEYLVVGIICDVVYGLVFVGIGWVYSLFIEGLGVKEYSTYEWIKTTERAMGITHSYSDYEEPPPMTLSAEEEAEIQRVLDSVYIDLSGKNRDY